jgi:glycosyltransferase involved in cell wall biosynthesis
VPLWPPLNNRYINSEKEGFLSGLYMSVEKPLMSIVTVVFNGESTIEKTISSVLEQPYPNIEYIIVDGQSTDRTGDILEHYCEKLTVVSEPDQGIYDAMNKGIGLSNGSVIGIINSDDWYEPDVFGRIAQVFFDDPEIELVHGDMNIFSSGGIFEYTLRKKQNPDYVRTVPFNHPTCFVRKTLYERLGGFDLSYPTAADYDFMLRAINDGAAISYQAEVLANFKKGGATTKTKKAPYSQIYRLFVSNDIGFMHRIEGLIYRFVRDITASVLSFPIFLPIQSWLISRLSYRK